TNRGRDARRRRPEYGLRGSPIHRPAGWQVKTGNRRSQDRHAPTRSRAFPVVPAWSIRSSHRLQPFAQVEQDRRGDAPDSLPRDATVDELENRTCPPPELNANVPQVGRIHQVIEWNL